MRIGADFFSLFPYLAIISHAFSTILSQLSLTEGKLRKSQNKNSGFIFLSFMTLASIILFPYNNQEVYNCVLMLLVTGHN
jgi:hypothetical protein